MHDFAWTLTKLDLSGTKDMHFYGWNITAYKMHKALVKEYKRANKQKQRSR